MNNIITITMMIKTVPFDPNIFDTSIIVSHRWTKPNFKKQSVPPLLGEGEGRGIFRINHHLFTASLIEKKTQKVYY